MTPEPTLPETQTERLIPHLLHEWRGLPLVRNSRTFTVFDTPVKRTDRGTPYLAAPGLVLLAQPHTERDLLRPFLDGFGEKFEDYLLDPDRGSLTDSEALAKTAGQLCYLSFGTQRTPDARADDYFDHIRESRHGCYDLETEVLTADGWKTWPDVTETDRLATRTASGTIEYHSPLRLIRYTHKGRMYRVEGQGVDLLVTPDHKMLACPTTTREGRRREMFTLIPASELGLRSHAYVKDAVWDGGKGPGSSVETPMKHDFLALLGFAIGDGFLASGSNTLSFHLRRERKVAWLRSVVRRLGWSLTENGDRYSVTIPEGVARGQFHQMYTTDRQKCIPQNLLTTCSRSLLEALYEGLMQADGHKGASNDSFDTTSPVLAGQFQQLCLHLGAAANAAYTYGPEERPTSYGKKPLTRLDVIRRALRPEVNRFVDTKARSYWVEDWEGEVFCAEVPNHTLYVRRNGIPVWSGNSVFEHATFAFLAWGVSRSLTHELVRHRIAGYSQVSQRYVGPKTLRFVERPEFVRDPALHGTFLDRIDATARLYENLTRNLADKGPPHETQGDRTARVKRTRQVARAVLPNETEAPILFSMNVRTLRHVLEMRGASGAEPEIRALFLRVFLALRTAAPGLFADYHLRPHPDDEDPVGYILSTPTPKV